MPEYSSTTLTPTNETKVPAMQNNNSGNFQLDALKAYILTEKAQANGLASLDAAGKLISSQIPANLDDVLVYGSYSLLPAEGEMGKLYITSDVNGTYYWNGTSYQMLNSSFVRYRGTVSSLPSDPHVGDWFIAASTFTEGGVTYTSGAMYLYNGTAWEDATAVFGQFVRKTDIAQSLGQQVDKVPSNKAVDDSMNLLTSAVADVEERVTDIEQAVESGYKYKGDCTYANLPTSGQQLGDLWYVTDRNDNYVWNGSVWRPQNNVGWAWVLQDDGNYKLGLLEH